MRHSPASIAVAFVSLALGCKGSSAVPRDSADVPLAASSVDRISRSFATTPKDDAMTVPNRYASYVSQWANGTRTSHVLTASRPVTSLVKVAAFTDWSAGDKIVAEPVGVLLDPANEHVVVRHARGFVVADLKGNVEARMSGEVDGLLLWEEGIFLGVGESNYPLTASPIALSAPRGPTRPWPDHVWAMRYEGERFTTVIQRPRTRNWDGGDVREPELEVLVHSVVRRADGNFRASVQTIDVLEATRAAGAVAKDGTIVVATTANDLVLYSSEPAPTDSPHRPPRLLDAKLAYAPYDACISGDEIALLEARGLPHSDTTPYRIEDDLARVFPSLGAHWTTRLHRLDRHGHETAHVDVPFEVLMPTILVGLGRAYVAGMGLAAVDGDKIVWSQKARTPLRATAFADGDLAVTVGEQLMLVARDGTVRQSFSTPGETIGTPPAIGPDGAVWFATDKALYVAR